MRLCIITTSMNSAATIEKTLQSVANQTWHDIEHIVVDGGSKDGTLDIIERYKSALAHVVSEPDNGIYDAMNKGIRLATGDYIGILNSDDVYYHPTVLEQVAQNLLETHVDALYGDVVYFAGDEPEHIIRYYSSAPFTQSSLMWGWMPAHPALFLKKSLFDRYGLYRSGYRIAGDFELVCRIFKNPDISFTYVPQAFVRMRMGGVSTRNFKNRWISQQEMFQACRDNDIPTSHFKLVTRYYKKVLQYLH